MSSIQAVQSLGPNSFDVSFSSVHERTLYAGKLSGLDAVDVSSYAAAEIIVTATRIPYELDDNYVRNWLNQYCAVITSRMVTYRDRPTIKNGNRQYKVVLKPGCNIPSAWKMYDGRMVFFRYVGQPRTCLRCNQEGHESANCAVTFCNKCQSIGHLAMDCTNDVVCLSCRAEGHTARRCPLSFANRIKMGASWAKSQELPAGVSQVREHHDGGVPQTVNKPDRSELAHVSDAESGVSDPVSPPGHPGSVDPGTSSAVKSDVSSPVAEPEDSPPVAVVEPSEDVLSEAAPSLTKFSPVAVVEPSEDLLSEAAPSLAKPGLSSSSSEQVPSTSAAPVPAPRARSQRRRRKAASPIRPVTRRYMCQGCELDYTITLEVVSCHQCKADITPESALLAFCEGPVCQSDNRLFLCQSCHDGNSDIADKDSRKRCRGDSSEGSASAKTLSKGKKIRKEPDSDSSLVIEEFPSESLRSVDGNESDSTVGSRSLIIDEDTSDASQAPSPDLVA
ncbi:uncharacterized protein LOC118405958 [Branchiostoma floridae]|uniref:Uncharacterized protein LOC118405958 n=1 Tax=Branchiostoma floridae TaxID=7739 RepID=A0A9J7HLD5_BRAFL|nr:uncharacterized protein LOC118405958 [Branchiostoma floridae]